MDAVFEPFDAVLRDGRKVHVREIRPTDEEAILQAFDRLAPGARYMRFMATIKSPNVGRLRSVLASFPERGMSIAAAVPGPEGIDIVGMSSFMLGHEPGSCEFAMAVLEAWGGAGLGRLLLGTLIEAARRRGLSAMHGFVLAENRPMLRLAERLGFEIARDPEDFGVRVCRLRLDAPPAPRSAP